MVVGGGESENLREVAHKAAPVNPEVFDSARQMSAAPVGDQVHVGDAGVARTPEADLAYAQRLSTETANRFLLRTSAVTPAEFQVMGGVLHLGLLTKAWDDNNIAQINECLTKRASEQSDPRAARGLTEMARGLTEMAQKIKTA
jgi:hypothetical protein